LDEKYKYFEANKKMWNEFAKEHFKTESDYYNVREFLEGKTTLRKYELDEVGDVKGKKLLHLQCHFGLDTLSWVREGAIVTGVDFSDDAIKLANQLTEQANLKADFILTNVYDLPKVLDEKFDVVYTSVGVLCWLNNLKKWAEVIAYFLKPGGIFYVHDGHPLSHVFDIDDKDSFVVTYDYFPKKEPMEFVSEGSYASKGKHMEPTKEYEWNHSLSEIINSLIDAGLRIQFLNEYPFSSMQSYSFTVKDENGYYRIPKDKVQIPIIFTLKAIKD